jgi:prevent-host-death family protein
MTPGLARRVRSLYNILYIRGVAMKPINPASDIVSLSEFRANVSEMLERAQQGRPIVITQNGRGAGVLLSAQAYEELVEELEVSRSLVSGMSDAAAGRVVPHDEAMSRLRAKVKSIEAKAKQAAGSRADRRRRKPVGGAA